MNLVKPGGTQEVQHCEAEAEANLTIHGGSAYGHSNGNALLIHGNRKFCMAYEIIPIYMYIYIYRERERERERYIDLTVGTQKNGSLVQMDVPEFNYLGVRF